MKQTIIKVLAILLGLYLYLSYKKGIEQINQVIMNAIIYDPLLILILFFGIVVFYVPSEIKMESIGWVYKSSFILISLAGTLYFLGIHGYNMKLAIDGIVLFLTGVFLTMTSGTAWTESLSRDEKSIQRSIQMGLGICTRCHKKISRFASKCPYCTSDL